MDELKKGWLSPTGEFYETGLYEHIRKARELVKALGAETDGRPDDTLVAAGWVSITLTEFGAIEWSIHWGWHHVLTPEQKAFLEPYFSDFYPVTEMATLRWKEAQL